MANRPIIRGIRRDEDEHNIRVPSGGPPSKVSPRYKGGQMFKADSGESDAIFGINSSGGGLDMLGGSFANSDDIGDDYTPYDAQDVAHEDLSEQILDLEAKIAKNVASFEDKMSDKEKEMVSECQTIFKLDKKKSKS